MTPNIALSAPSAIPPHRSRRPTIVSGQGGGVAHGLPTGFSRPAASTPDSRGFYR